MKLLFIDIDGTLCSPTTNQVPPSARIAIQKAREKGHQAILCTGRSLAEIYEDILSVGFDGITGGNGAYVEYKNQVLTHRLLAIDQVRHFVDWCKARNIEYYLECNSGLYPSEKYKEAVQSYFFEKTGKVIEYGSFFDEMIYHQDPYRSDVNKISFLLHDWSDYEAAKQEFLDCFIGFWGGEAGQASHGDISPLGINKKVAIEQVLHHLRVDKKDCIAFGDASVDLPMFESVGYGVAMGDGEEILKKKADFITKATDEDGLAFTFESLKLID